MRVTEFLGACEGSWHRAAPATPGVIDALVEASGLPLPADYLEFLRACNGGEGFLDVQPLYLQIWPAEEVIGNNLDYGLPEEVPGFFGFGSSGGGECLAFNTNGSQPWPVVSIPFIGMEAEIAWSVAPSFSNLLDHVEP